MTFGNAFWVLMFIWFIYGIVWNWRGDTWGPYGPVGHGLLVFCLFMLSGWKLFGPPLH